MINIGPYKIRGSIKREKWEITKDEIHKKYLSSLPIAVWYVYQLGLIENSTEDIDAFLRFSLLWKNTINNAISKFDIKIEPSKETVVYMANLQTQTEIENECKPSRKRKKK